MHIILVNTVVFQFQLIVIPKRNIYYSTVITLVTYKSQHIFLCNIYLCTLVFDSSKKL